MAFTARVFRIVQRADLLNLTKIEEALKHLTIKRYAYIMHDKDTYVADDVEKEREALTSFFSNAVEVNLRTANSLESDIGLRSKLTRVMADGAEQFVLQDRVNLSEVDFIDKYNSTVVGSLKPKHLHIVLKTDKAIEPKTIARWFDVPAYLVDCPKGKGAFLDCVEYVSHSSAAEQAKGKHLYDDSEVIANFDWRAEITQNADKIAKFGRAVSEKEEIRHKVLYEGYSLRQLCVDKPLAYQSDYATLDKFRCKYISERAPIPQMRINYYICGRGGVGKGLICRALARSLYPHLENDDDIFFEVGANGVTFDGYDGQPVVIWNDQRGYDLVQKLGGRGNFFNVFDMHPTRGKQNVKYASVCLTNEVNIVNGIQDYTDFLDSIVGEYERSDGTLNVIEDKGQSYRRFPFIIPLHETDFDLLMNKGVFFGTREYDQYIGLNGFRGNMQRVVEACKGNEQLRKKIESKTVEVIVQKHSELLKKESENPYTEAEILEMFADYGTIDGITPEQYFAEPIFDDEPINKDEFRQWLTTPAGQNFEMLCLRHSWEQDEMEEVERLAKAVQLDLTDLPKCEVICVQSEQLGRSEAV